jgi:hypothetical protein
MIVDRTEPYFIEVAAVLQLIARDCRRELLGVKVPAATLDAAAADPWRLLEADMADRPGDDLETLSHFDPSGLALTVLGVDNLGVGGRAILPVYQAYRDKHPLVFEGERARMDEDEDQDDSVQSSILVSIASDKSKKTLFDRCADVLEKEYFNLLYHGKTKEFLASWADFVDPGTPGRVLIGISFAGSDVNFSISAHDSGPKSVKIQLESWQFVASVVFEGEEPQHDSATYFDRTVQSVADFRAALADLFQHSVLRPLRARLSPAA